MKNQLLNDRVWTFKTLFYILFAGIIFSIIKPETVSAQGGIIITGQLFVYKSVNNEADTTGLVGHNLYVKFYRLNGANQLIFVASAPVDSTGFYRATVYTNQDLYAILPGDDEDNFSTTFYPGWLDFESADPISPSDAINGVIDYDWGAVGKEIVERPSGNISNLSGIVTTAVPFFQDKDLVPSVSLLGSDGNLISSAPIGTDGKYHLTVAGAGNYEVFTSIPGFASQSKYITVTENSKSDLNVNFNLDVYRGQSDVTPNSVANSFNLNQNYPNPFNPTTNINFTVNTTGLVKLTVYNSQGKEVSKLVNDLMEPGTYDIQFNAQNLASGVYYYSLQVGNNVITKKMNLLK